MRDHPTLHEDIH